MEDMTAREMLIRRYFVAWLVKDGSVLESIFCPDVVYSECYGPEYHGISQIQAWFSDWNKCGTVLAWPIKQFVHQKDMTAVEWYFECDYDGKTDGFDGMSLIQFAGDGRIVSLKEFQSKALHHCPYGQAQRPASSE